MTRCTNASELSRTPARATLLRIIEAGLEAIDTTHVVQQQVHLDGDTLSIADHSVDLSHFKRVYVIGFGKASLEASITLESILGNRITGGIALTNKPGTCSIIEIAEATHPRPSAQNIQQTHRIIEQCETLTHDDLVLVVVSGGGSAMLCWPASECDQGQQLYDDANRTGMTIQELNVVRKHVSALKGGGLARHLYPATVIGLIFSDVPGTAYDMVASGPTYLDTTTIADAQEIINRHAIGPFNLTETPKDLKFFEKITNIVLVSNVVALAAMAAATKKEGYASLVLGSDCYDTPEVLANRMLHMATPHSVVLAGGETRQMIPADHGAGGRNQHVALIMLERLHAPHTFAAIASDGLDNGDAAGALVDHASLRRIHELGLPLATHLQRFDERPIFSATQDLIFTGPTGENVSDLMLLLTE